MGREDEEKVEGERDVSAPEPVICFFFGFFSELGRAVFPNPIETGCCL